MSNIKELYYQCPKHKTLLQKEKDELICEKDCRYPIVEGIPRFVPSSDYSAAFGEQWKHYRKTQLDSYTKLPLSEDRLRRCFGEDLWNDLEGKQILEAGCGAGRFTELLLAQKAVVTSIDMSEAVDANQENCPQDETHRIAQADIWQLPFESEKFDVVMCLGVIQHTPIPEKTIAALANQVKKGGWLIIDHYTYKLGNFTRTAPLVRLWMRKLPHGKTIALTEKMVNAFLPWHKSMKNFRLGQTLLSRISPLICYYHGIPELDDEQQREWALLDTHDSLTDYYKFFRTKKQILITLQNLGLTNIWCEYGGNGVEARARRPLD